MSKHTAGRWYVNTDRGMSEYCVCAESRGKGFGSSVATVTQRDGEKSLPHDEAMANARLIAAAPDLLAACQMVMTLRRVGGMLPGVRELLDSIVDDAEAAIAKATGAGHE